MARAITIEERTLEMAFGDGNAAVGHTNADDDDDDVIGVGNVVTFFLSFVHRIWEIGRMNEGLSTMTKKRDASSWKTVEVKEDFKTDALATAKPIPRAIVKQNNLNFFKFYCMHS